MYGYFYDRKGEAIGVRQGEHIFDLQGYAIGYVQGDHVYKMTGEYVGEIFQDMIVNQYISNPGSIGSVMSPGRIPPIERPPPRGAADYGYPDVSHELLE
jgi:hypothetical protein